MGGCAVGATDVSRPPAAQVAPLALLDRAVDPDAVLFQVGSGGREGGCQGGEVEPDIDAEAVLIDTVGQGGQGDERRSVVDHMVHRELAGVAAAEQVDEFVDLYEGDLSGIGVLCQIGTHQQGPATPVVQECGETPDILEFALEIEGLF